MSRWTEPEDAVLRAEWRQGTPVRAIAAKLPNRSRCSVIGRAHLLDLPKRSGDLAAPRKRAPRAAPGDRIYNSDSWSVRLFEPWADRKARLARERAHA